MTNWISEKRSATLAKTELKQRPTYIKVKERVILDGFSSRGVIVMLV